jgi:1-aminocyclopropane-1-carboxylate deaminase
MLQLPFSPPVQQIELPSFSRHGVMVSVKREDLIHPFISGNKWRKLKYVLEDAKTSGRKILVSFGGAYSNHLVALACAGAMHGFKTAAFVRGEEVSNQVLSLCKLYGMELRFVSREAYRNKRLLFDDLAGNREEVYFIDEGGKGELAVKGCEEILHGITGFTHAVCAVGTGTTIAGLARGAKQQGIIAEGICVLKGAEEMDKEVADAAGFGVKIHHGFHRGGYAKTDEQLLAFIKLFARQTGILLDQVYTAKMMMAIEQLIEENYYPEGSHILAIHTGGLLGMMSIL